MMPVAQEQYVTGQELAALEEQTRRKWKVLLILLALALQNRTESEVRQDDAAQAPPGAGRVLLVTEAPSALELTRAIESGGFEVMPCPNVRLAAQQLDRASVIVLDEDMPGSEELCARVHQKMPVPVILLGSEPDSKAWDRAAAMGADAYLKRMVGHKELVARIKVILRRYQQAY
ncbi:MAG: response regulator transcription factor [Chloroflexi bacterium]|nr:response regulator transcription factor [Chloroflexota bacterium]